MDERHVRARELLAGLALFDDFDDDTRAALLEATALLPIAAGRQLFAEGDAADGMYVVVSGRLALTSESDGARRLVAEVGRGAVVGEMALLTDRPRSATATATRDTVLAHLPVEAVTRIVLRNPASLLRLSRTLVDRVLDGDRPRSTPARTVALRAVLGQNGDTAATVMRGLEAQFAVYGAVATADARAVDEAVGDGASATDPGSPVSATVSAWLDRLEASVGHVLLDASGPDGWTQRCVRHADVTLLVAEASTGPTWAAATGPSVNAVDLQLVLVHAADTVLPAGTDAWMHPSISQYHHVRRGSRADLARVARLVTGRGVGLVLGGGGARGFAHLGVMQALDEAGVPVDLYGGTSIGSIMSGFAALGAEHEDRVRLATDAFVTRRLIGSTLPLVSLSSSRKVTRRLRDPAFLGDNQIEDLWYRYLCVSVDLASGDEVVHETGPLWRAARASISLPGIFPPVADAGRLLVDGGVLNNVPVNHVRARLGGGTVIAVDLEAQQPPLSVDAFAPDVTGWQVLRSRLHPFRPSITPPGPVEALLRARGISAARVQREQFAVDVPDLMIRPHLGAGGLLDFRHGPDLIEAGYRAALTALASTPISV